MSDDSGESGQAALASLCERIDALDEAVAALEGELQAVGSAVDEVISRLDAGLVLADEIVAPPPSVPTELTGLLAALEELRADMAALRRRIKVQADGRVLSDEQLEQIAEIVAQRVARLRAVKAR